MKETHTLIIGASISGLASAVCLKKQNIPFLIIEKQDQVAKPWHNHYQRLHLHTNKRRSSLPYKKFDANIPRYPDREQVLNYLNEYQKEFEIDPQLNTEALSIKRENGYWITETRNGDFKSKYLIMATGAYGKPRSFEVSGMETFAGKILHSSNYKTGKDFTGQKVLVVGFGNSSCEIAMDLYEQGAYPWISVRSPVNVISRDLFGIPILEISLLLNYLPTKVADVLGAPLIKLAIGDITRYGLEKMPYGPLQQIRNDHKAPVLDIGTMEYIRKGYIQVCKGIDHIKGKTVFFKDGKAEDFDAIVAGVGYDHNPADIVQTNPSRFEDLKYEAGRQKYFGKDNLYFCGYWISPTGQIREISMDAKKIAKDIAQKEKNLYL